MMINLDFIYPIGTIYETTSTVHPNISLGGTWELYGSGRVTVCVDTNQSEFDTIDKTGGNKYIQNHEHSISIQTRKYSDLTYGLDATFFAGEPSGQGQYYITRNSGKVSDVTTGNSGNLQPYIVVYRYRRVA